MLSEYVIAKYLRLSIEDDKTESLSIENQHLLLDRHIDGLELPNARVLNFVDNGHTGVNMERAAMQEMLGLVRAGGVNLIVFKDFSRFSRNAMDSGYFIEQVFPLYQVRVISVSDDYDSDNYIGDAGGIDVAFKFLMHEYYSADLSAKVKSAKRLQMKRGENIVAKAIYGYHKVDGRWEPDGVASEVVRRIYDLALAGFSPAQIRDKLFAEKIPTPQEYLELGRGKDISPTFLWEARAVTRILTNEQYKGSYISGKQEQKAIGSRSKNWVDKADWIIFPNHHTPIIEPDVFDRVQEIMKSYLASEPSPKTARHCQGDKGLQHDWINKLPYGYSKDGSGQWRVDPDSGAVVRRIFDLALKGVREADIAQALADERHPTPREFRGKCVTPAYAWRAKGVRDILRDVQYTGAYVPGKFGQKPGGGYYRTHESDWIIRPGAIPAIVNKAEFDTVADIMANRGKRQMQRLNYLLRGNIVKCGCCGYAMAYDKSAGTVFRCYHTAANPGADCHKMKVSAVDLDEIVLEAIRSQAERVLRCADLAKLRRKTADEQKIADCKVAIEENLAARQMQYERFVSGEISREEYFRLKAEWGARHDRLEHQLGLMQAELDATKVDPHTLAAAKSAVDETANERELVETLIKTVRVFPDKRVEIGWKINEFGSAM